MLAPAAAPPVLPMPEHHLLQDCYMQPMNPDPLKSSGLENLLGSSTAKSPSTSQTYKLGDQCRQSFSYNQAICAPMPGSNPKAPCCNIHLPDIENKREADEEAPVPRIFTSREHLYAELASLSSKDSKATLRSVTQPMSVPATSFTICCNSCDSPIPNAHYHCSICDDGDFDLCEICHNNLIRCNGDDHWLVKRYVKDGKVTSSSTETVAPKKAAVSLFDVEKDLQPNEIKKEVPGAFTQEIKEAFQDAIETSRTCNSCVGRKCNL